MHEYNIAGLDGDEEIWLLYEPDEFSAGYFQVTTSVQVVIPPENDDPAGRGD